MAAEVVGTAYVRIRAITTKLAADIKDGIDKGAADADKDVHKSGTNVGKTIAEGVKEGLGEAVGDGIANTIGDALTDDKKVRKTSSGLGRKLGLSTATGFFSAFSENVTESFKNTSFFTKAFKKLGDIKFTGLSFLVTAGLPVLIGLLKTAAYYIVGLVAQLSYLATTAAGAGAAVGGLFVGVVPALGVLMATLKTASPELEAFKWNIAAVGEQWKKVGKIGQKDLLPGLNRAADMISDKLIPLLEPYAKGISKITAWYATWATAVLTSERSLDHFGDMLDASREIWDNVGQSVVSVLETLAPIMNALAGICAQISLEIRDLTGRFKDMILTMSDTGSLESTFQKWYDQAKNVFGGIVDLVVGVWTAMKVGSDEASGSWDNFREFAKAFRWWAASPEGQDKLHNFFATALEVMKEVNLLLKDIIGLLFTPLVEGDNDNIVSGLQALRLTVLPAIVDLVHTITDNIDAGTLQAFMLSFVQLIDALQSSGVLSVSLVIVTESMKVLTAVLQSDIGPYVADFLGLVWGLSAISKIPGVGFILGQVADGLLAVGAALAKMVFGVEVLTLGSVLTSIGTGFSNFITAVGMGAESGGVISAGGGIMESIASGIGAVGSALGGISAGAAATFASVLLAIGAFYTAGYFLSDNVREKIDELWESFNTLRDSIGDVFVGEGSLKSRLEQAYIDVQTFFSNVLSTPTESLTGGIADLFNGNVFEHMGGAVDVVEEKVGEITGAITGAFSGLGDQVKPKLEEIGTKVSEWATGLPDQIRGWLGTAAGAVGGAVSGAQGASTGAAGALLSWIDNAISSTATKLGQIVGHIGVWALLLPGRIKEKVLGAASALVSFITESIPQMAINFAGWISEMKLTIQNWIMGIPAWFDEAKTNFTAWVGELWELAKVKFEEFKTNMGIWIDEWILGMPEKLGGLVDKFEEVFINIRDSIWSAGEGAVSWLGDVSGQIWDWLADVGKQIPTKAKAIVDGFIGLGKDILHGMLEGLQNAAGAVTGWFGDFLGGVFQGAKDEMESESPSKKFMRLGNDMMLGLAMGLEGGSAGVTSAMDSIMKDISSAGATIGSSFNADVSAVSADFGKIQAAPTSVVFAVDVTANGNLTDAEAQRLGMNIVKGAQTQMSRSDMAAKVAMA